MDLTLYKHLDNKVKQWRKDNYISDFETISEILNYNFLTYQDENEFDLKYLRKPQFEALETYWYLRLVENTPKIFDLYRSIFSDPIDLLKALNIPTDDEKILKLSMQGGIEHIINEIKTNDDFVKEYHLEVVKESIELSYPSYILALAMGVGKTVLIGSIVATEFALSFDYPDENFVKNALVFAPGKTILGALKEIAMVPYEKILPPRLYKIFNSSKKYQYTKDGEKDIPIINKSDYNIIVTNTEKIRITKNKITQTLLKSFSLNSQSIGKAKEAIANQRLRTITSLSNLAIFSDEAHHLYGNNMTKGLKRIRETVNYISDNTNLITVVNTTGTPYYKKEMLKDVIFWYGLSQGISDGILKDVSNNIVGYDEVTDEEFFKDVISDYFENYEEVVLPNGALSKLAIYFPKIDSLRESKGLIETHIASMGLDPSMVLEVNNESSDEIKDLFDNRINNPHVKYRVFLLVNKGTEGWNCPSLFATALARELRSSNNFCLQAATRCMRQVSGNSKKAKIYLSKNNVRILNSQLLDAFGESLQIINRTAAKTIRDRIYIKKENIPPLKLIFKEKRVVPLASPFSDVLIKLPSVKETEKNKIIYNIQSRPDGSGPLVESDIIGIEKIEDLFDIFSASHELSVLYGLNYFSIFNQLSVLYPEYELPLSHVSAIKIQIENQLKRYKIIEETKEKHIALIKKEGFNMEQINSKSYYYAEIVYNLDRSKHILKMEDVIELNKTNLGFHYTPYNFDSGAEQNFFLSMLDKINLDLEDVTEIFFTGGINDPAKTDYLFDYFGNDKKWHKYNPDFLIHLTNNQYLIVEIKDSRLKYDKVDGIDGLKSATIKELVGVNPDKLKYKIIFAESSEIDITDIKMIEDVVREFNE